MIYFKYNTLVFLLFFLLKFIPAQMNERIGRPFGISAFGGLKMNSSMDGYKNSSGFLTGFGVTTSIANVVFPELNYSFSNTSYGEDSIGKNLINKSKSLGFSLNSKISAFYISLGKSSKQECWGLGVKLLLGYNYSLNFKNDFNFNYVNQNDSGLELGLGINPTYSGGHKSRVSWSYYYEIIYRLDLNKNNQFAIDTHSAWQQNGLFIKLTVLHYNTFNFLARPSKEKSYKRKY